METSVKIEFVICTCGQEHSIMGGVCCLKCNRKIPTRFELCEQRIDLARRLAALSLEIAKVDIELFMRKEHKPIRKVLYYEDFFKGVKKVPMTERRRNTRDFRSEARAMLAGLDL